MAVIQFALLAFPLLAWYIWNKIQYHRLKQYAHFPQPKPDPFWGHLKAINDAGTAAHAIKGRHSDYDFKDLWISAGKQQVCLFDIRPVMYPILLVCDHQLAEQIARPSALFKYGTYKSPTTKDLAPIIGHKSILVSENEHWKQQRKRYNAGFAPSHLITQLAQIVDKTKKFLAKLDEHADKGDAFELHEHCVNLTFDIIGAVVMDLDFHAQDGVASPIAQATHDALLAFSGDSPLERIDPFIQYRRWKLGKVIDRRMKDAVKAKHEEIKAAERDGVKSGKPRSVVGIALEGNDVLSEDLLQDAADQIKTFLFAGHDTTSILLQWIFYELSRHPKVLATLTKELDDVLGPSASPEDIASTLIQGGEPILNQLSYTSAIIKEALRLYPPAGSARMAPPGSNSTITLKDGTELCVDGMVIYICHYIIQRDEKIYGPDANEFIPERWLGDTETSMSGTDHEHTIETRVNGSATTTKTDEKERTKIPASAWRPFERGPRNCIGQELANLETRVILAMAVRRYRFEKVGMGSLVLDGEGKPVMNGKGVYEVKNEMINKRQITSKPFDNMLMKVSVNS